MSPRIMPHTNKSLRNNFSTTAKDRFAETSNDFLKFSNSKESVKDSFVKKTYGFSIQSSVDNTRDSVDAPKIPTTASAAISRNSKTINQYGRNANPNQTFTSFNHKNGKAVVRPLSGAKYNPYEIIKTKKNDI